MKRTIALLICLILVLSIPAFAARTYICAKSGKASYKMGKASHGKIMGEIELTKDQKAKMEALKEKLQKDNKDLAAKKQKLNKELKALMKEEDLDIGRIEGKMKEISSIQTKMKINALKKKKEMKKILTKEQKAQMKKMQAERM
ncbi:Spy/CpxP family protein refolding chaperone, partial [Candidatus Margulisiibacteriota bacterium]